MSVQSIHGSVCNFYRKTEAAWEPVQGSNLRTGDVVCMRSPQGSPLVDEEGFSNFLVAEAMAGVNALCLDPLTMEE